MRLLIRRERHQPIAARARARRAHHLRLGREQEAADRHVGAFAGEPAVDELELLCHRAGGRGLPRVGAALPGLERHRRRVRSREQPAVVGQGRRVGRRDLDQQLIAARAAARLAVEHGLGRRQLTELVERDTEVAVVLLDLAEVGGERVLLVRVNNRLTPRVGALLRRVRHVDVVLDAGAGAHEQAQRALGAGDLALAVERRTVGRRAVLVLPALAADARHRRATRAERRVLALDHQLVVAAADVGGEVDVVLVRRDDDQVVAVGRHVEDDVRAEVDARLEVVVERDRRGRELPVGLLRAVHPHDGVELIAVLEAADVDVDAATGQRDLVGDEAARPGELVVDRLGDPSVLAFGRPGRAVLLRVEQVDIDRCGGDVFLRGAGAAGERKCNQKRGEDLHR